MCAGVKEDADEHEEKESKVFLVCLLSNFV